MIDIPMPSYRMPEVKNSSGYYARDGMDPIDLFIGQEGTLAVAIEAEIALVRKPDEIFSCFAFFSGEEESRDFVREAKALDPLSIEYMDSNALDILRKKGMKIPSGARAAIFFEKDVEREDPEREIGRWQALLKRHGISEDDVWAATTEDEAERFVDIRHSIPDEVNETIRKSGYQKISTDIAVPDEAFTEMMDFYAVSFRDEPLRHVIFGHIGENHLHVNILPESKEELAKADAMALAFVRKGVSLGGTVSAEHGIGKIKKEYLKMLYGEKGINEMIEVKKKLDPEFILNRGNLF